MIIENEKGLNVRFGLLNKMIVHMISLVIRAI
jgi:hypothetical protein